jgi:hypothetical protein
MAAFGFSVGDFISGIVLVRNIFEALQDSRGASAEFRETIQQLYSLERSLLAVKHLQVDDSLRTLKDELDRMLRAFQDTLSGFLTKIYKYHPTLRLDAWSFTAALRKVQWSLFKKDEVYRFRAQISGHMSYITTMILTIQLQAMATQSEKQQANIENLEMINTAIDSNTVILQSFITDILPKTISHFTSVSNMWTAIQNQTMALTQLTAEIKHVVLEVHDISSHSLSAIKSLQDAIPPQVYQKPVYFVDAAGDPAPFLIEFIDCWDAFEAVLKIRFKDRGLLRIEQRYYNLEDGPTNQEIIRSMPFNRCFRPGRFVNMNVLCRQDAKSDVCPSCRLEQACAKSDKRDVEWYILDAVFKVHFLIRS